MEMAGELHSNRLYQAAVDEYERALSYDGIEAGKRANLNYLIARIYFEDIPQLRAGGGLLLAGAGVRPRWLVYAGSIEKPGRIAGEDRQCG